MTERCEKCGRAPLNFDALVIKPGSIDGLAARILGDPPPFRVRVRRAWRILRGYPRK